MEEKNVLSIDVEKVIESKNEKLARRLPRFVLSYLKRVIHQDEINRLLRKEADVTGVEFASNILKDLNVSCNVINTGASPLDLSKRYVFVSNHPLGGLDGMVLISYFGNLFGGKVKFMVNDLLNYIVPLQSVFVPIDKYGKMKHGNTEKFVETFGSDDQILYFPAGLCSRLIRGEVKDLEWKKSFVTKAIESGRDVVPLFFSGRNSKFFYRLANIRKKMGIKFNIETLYLPDEMFKQAGATFDLYIGDPVPHYMLVNGMSHREWCARIRKECYKLPDKKYLQ